jgi:hypothetical protein
MKSILKNAANPASVVFPIPFQRLTEVEKQLCRGRNLEITLGLERAFYIPYGK